MIFGRKKKQEKSCYNKDGSRKNVTGKQRMRNFEALAKKEQRIYLRKKEVKK